MEDDDDKWVIPCEYCHGTGVQHRGSVFERRCWKCRSIGDERGGVTRALPANLTFDQVAQRVGPGRLPSWDGETIARLRSKR